MKNALALPVLALLAVSMLLSCGGGSKNVSVIAKGTGFNIGENIVKGGVTIFYFYSDW